MVGAGSVGRRQWVGDAATDGKLSRTASVHELHVQGRLSSALYSRPADRSSVTPCVCSHASATPCVAVLTGRHRVAVLTHYAWAESDARSCPASACHASKDYYGRCRRVMSHLATRSHSQRAAGGTIHARSRAVGDLPRSGFGHTSPWAPISPRVPVRPPLRRRRALATSRRRPPAPALTGPRRASPRREPRFSRPRGSRSGKVASPPGRTTR